MDAKSLGLLEMPLVRARLAAATSFDPSRRLAEALEPSNDPVIVARWLDETDEARALLQERPGVGIGGAHDIGPATERAARGGRLEAAQFVAIGETLEAASRLAEALAGERRPLLRDLGRAIQPLPALRSVLDRSFDPAGELLDSASPRLGGLRRAVRIAYERLRARLDTLVHSSELGGALQEPIITLRNGRYVVPVRAEARGKVKGIVHDASGSGQTLFVEPIVAVELGNAWREAQLAEQVEVERILDELSALVGAQAPALRSTLEALARFDLWSAKARLAAEMDATRAATSPTPRIVLKGARHPGLAGRVVPIDIELGGEFTALVITGPNTGGKTVTLRTIGLLCLMHQTGLHVPAEAGSSLPVLRDVFADIGDEQSIAQSLSTFSGHLRSITRIVGAAGPDTLVLLDELGAGTDPTEGSALAQALLDHFIRAGALVAATTHYAELKVYAHATPAARNASVEFDLETLSPTYRVSIGLPGTSHAFAIAERLGLPPAIVDDARSRLSEGQVAFEETLASIREHEGEAVEALARARAAEAKALERAAPGGRGATEGATRARRGGEGRARRGRPDRRVDARGGPRRPEAARARDAHGAGTGQDRRRDRRACSRSCRRSRSPPPSRQPATPVAWRVGMRARSRTRGWEGRVAALERGGRRATLEVGGMRVTVGRRRPRPGHEPRRGAPAPARRPARRRADRLHPGAAARPGPDDRVVARPPGGTRRGGAGAARALSRRRVARRAPAGDDRPRPRHRRPPGRGAEPRLGPPARPVLAARRAWGGGRRGHVVEL